MAPRILLTAGGTGGHIFPAIALAEELHSRYDCSILFAAGKLSQNKFFQDSPFSFKDISCSSAYLKGMGSNLKGVVQALQVISEYKPDVVIGFGSYYTLPILIASKLLRKPLLLHEANSVPGLVNRMFSPIADKTWVSFPIAKKSLRGCVDVCQMPLRPLFKKGIVSKKKAKGYFGLEEDVQTLLIFGGSQGAKALNALFSDEVLPFLKGFQIIHFTGLSDDVELLSARYAAHGIQACVKAFEKRMDLAWAAADLAVTRAGASSIGEQIEYGVRGILIPYPFATDNHQDSNADFLVDRGLGVKIHEHQLTPEIFIGKLMDLFQSEPLSKCDVSPLSDFSDEIIKWLKK